MTKHLLVLLGTSLLIATPAMAQKKGKLPAAAPKTVIMTTLDTVSYSLGLNIARNLKSQGLGDINLELFAQAMKDHFTGGPTAVDVNQTDQIINGYFSNIKKKQGDDNLVKGRMFLEENKKKTGIQTTASGLQYEIIKEGNGPKPTAADKVKCHYHGTLIDGTVFDSSVQRGEPATFPLNGVIKGWTEALQLMPTGSKWRLYLPAELAYGDRGAGNSIGPNNALIFEVELLSIEK
jgi:FKBP-type peptidyl-prolyl cis-trans isomerase FklB